MLSVVVVQSMPEHNMVETITHHGTVVMWALLWKQFLKITILLPLCNMYLDHYVLFDHNQVTSYSQQMPLFWIEPSLKQFDASKLFDVSDVKNCTRYIMVIESLFKKKFKKILSKCTIPFDQCSTITNAFNHITFFHKLQSPLPFLTIIKWCYIQNV
jgi:hypothetical protein